MKMHLGFPSLCSCVATDTGWPLVRGRGWPGRAGLRGKFDQLDLFA